MDAKKTGPKGLNKPRLTALNRLDIEACLNDGKLPYAIAKRIGCDIRTVIREILARAKSVDIGAACRLANKCVHRMTCERRRICAKCLHRRERLCRLCNQCNSHCPEYREDFCAKLQKSPFVCNSCTDRRKCVLTKRFYRGEAAQKDYETILSESRRGVNLTEEEIGKFDGLMCELVNKGQSIHAIMANNPGLFPFCEKSAYRYVNANLLLTKRHNLPRACSIKPRKGDKPVEAKADKLCRVGREYARYQAKLAANPGMDVTEMDTLEGARGGKCLLTLIFNPTNFMASFLLEAKTSACVTAAFGTILARLAELYGGDSGMIFGTYEELFSTILTDLGSEFTDPTAIESPALAMKEGPRLVELYYCDPYSAWQKAHVEHNHELVRYILPKATAYTAAVSLDGLTQDDVELMMSHVNSYPRKILRDRKPFDLFAEKFGADIAEKVFGVRKVNPNDVVLKPSLLGLEVKVKEWVLKCCGVSKTGILRASKTGKFKARPYFGFQ